MELIFSVYSLLIILLTITSLISSTRTYTSNSNNKNYLKIKPQIENLPIIHSEPFEIRQEEIKSKRAENIKEEFEDQVINKELYNINEKYIEPVTDKTKIYNEQDRVSTSFEDKHTHMKTIEGKHKRIDKIKKDEEEIKQKLQVNEEIVDTNFEDIHNRHMKTLEGHHKKSDRFTGKEEEIKKKLKEQYKVEEELKTNLEESDFDFETSSLEFNAEYDKVTGKKSKNYLDKYLNEYDTIPINDYRTEIHTDDQLDTNRSKKNSPEDIGLKSSIDLPFPDLIENINQHYDPKEIDLNQTVLIKRLGKNFDSNFMSINKPNDSYYSKSNLLQINNLTRNKNGKLISIHNIPNYLNKINFKYIYLPDGSKIRTRIGLKLKRKMIQFLQTYTKCIVNYKWKDLGVRFWPRYLRSGFCVNQSISCSIPPGMTCKPDENQYKTILRYHCRKQTNTCSWKNVKYPIVTSCNCTCP